MRSFKGKIKTLLQQGVEPLTEGVDNFRHPVPEMELLAKERMVTCSGCEHFENEPIDFLRVEDSRIPELSNKMCGDCFCTLSYKLRQNKKICHKWKQ